MANKQTTLQKFNRKYTLDGSTGVLGTSVETEKGYRVYGETTVRISPKSVGGTNVIDVEARIEGESTFTTIGTVVGTTSATFGIETYDYIRFNVTTADGSGEVIASGFFNQLGTLDGSVLSSFKTIQTDSGTSPVAEDALDTLTLTSSDSSLSIAGNSTTDTVDFTVDESNIDHNSLLNTHNLTTDIDHDALTNFDIAEHRIINDAGTSATELWSANKINSEFGNYVPYTGANATVDLNTQTLRVNDILGDNASDLTMTIENTSFNTDAYDIIITGALPGLVGSTGVPGHEGGKVVIQTQSGGGAGVTSDGGKGGPIEITAGDGGQANYGGGLGGDIIMTSGTGNVPISGLGSGSGGGDFIMTGGEGKDGSYGGGDGGSFTMTAGEAGSSNGGTGNGDGGHFYITGGDAGSGSGTAGVGGSIYLNGGNGHTGPDGKVIFQTTASFQANTIMNDVYKAYFGTGSDASISYDGASFDFNSQEAGSGDYNFYGGDAYFDGDVNVGSTQTVLVQASKNVSQLNVDEFVGAKYLVTIVEEGTKTNKLILDVLVIHNGTSAADATTSNYVVLGSTSVGTAPPYTITTVLSGAGANQVVHLQFTSTNSTTITATQYGVLGGI